MEWREALEKAASEDELDLLAQRLAASRRQLLAHIAQLLDEEGDAAAAAQQVRALMFLERFGADIEERLAQLGQ
jgi:molecular chaperone HscB